MKDINNAIIMATKAHEGQFRKATGIPYIFHPLEVAMMLAYEGASADVIIAALLHDTLEDTELKEDDIKAVFGEHVLKLVKSSSEIECDKRGSETWKYRKEHTLKCLKEETDKDVLMIVCADKLSNIKSINNDLMTIGEKVWERFNQPKEMQKWYYINLIDSLSKLKEEKMFKEFCSIVNKVFGV